MKRILLTFILTLILTGLKGQDIDNIVPAAPEAAKMAEYTFTPTNLYRGTTQLSVPLYTIDFYGMSLPISMSYSSGGIRANEDAGLIGLGWSLQHTGVISRTIMGRDDLYKNSGDANAPQNLNLTDGYVFNTVAIPEVPENFNSTDYRDFFWSSEATAVKAGSADTQPDIFSLSLFGINTKFVLSKISNGVVNVVKLTEDANRIEFDMDNFNFTVTTPTGFVAVFDQKARSTVVSGSDPNSDKWLACGSGKVNFSQNGGIYPNGKFRRITSWYLSTITSPTGRTITFNYDTVSSDQSEYVSVSAASFGEKYSFESSGSSVSVNTGPQPDSPTYEPNTCTRIIHEHFYPTSIVSSDMQLNISFTKASRVDLRKPDLGTNQSEYYLTTTSTVYHPNATFNDLQRITDIDITSTSSYSGSSPSFSKSIEFDQTYFSAGSGDDHRFKRLRLDGVTVDDQVWEFEYNGGLPDKSTNGIDYWGFYNGRNDDQDLLPAYVNPITDPEDWTDLSFYYQQTNRKANETYAEAGLLTKVIYPTGGETRYDYEANTYRITEGEYSTEGVAPNYVAGAFIAESETSTFVFNNGSGGDCTFPGYMNINLRFNSYSGGYNGPVLTADLNEYAVELVDATNDQVVSSWATWREIEESPSGTHYQESIPILAAGEYYVRVKRVADGNGQTLYYASVEVTLPTSCDQTTGSSGSVVTDQTAGGLRIASIKNYDSRQGLVGKKRFKYTTTESGQEVSSGVLMTPLRNIYLSTPSSGSGAFAFIFSSPSQLPHANTAMGGFLGYTQVTEINEKLSSGVNNGEIISVFMNRPNDVINASVVNGFENTNGKLFWRGVFDTNDDPVRETKYFYEVRPTTSVRALAYRIFQHSIFGAQMQFSTNYYLKSEFVAPETIENEEVRGGETISSSQKMTYNDDFQLSTQKFYSEPNVLASSTSHLYPGDYTSPSSIISGMLQDNLVALPIETVKRLGTNELSASATIYKSVAGTYLPDKSLGWNKDLGAYQSSSDGTSFSSVFEELGQVLAYDSKGNPIEFVDRAGVHTAMIWGYNDNYPVAKVVNATHAQAVAVLNTSVLNAPATNSALRTELDKLRSNSALSTALATTMTYEPLVGMDSQTSADGLTVFYQYDSNARLRYIKDHEGNILKRVEYEYQETIANTTK